MSRDNLSHRDLESDVQEMNLKEENTIGEMDTAHESEPVKQEPFGRVGALRSITETPAGSRRQSSSPMVKNSGANSPAVKPEHEETIGGDVTVKLEPGMPPKLTRSTSHKIEKRPPQLFFDHPDSTAEACSSFALLKDCTYANKHLGTTEHALECDCSEEWDMATQSNNACGDDSDCINRATKMECVGDCGCGSGCQNRRFQHKEYADVTVIRTEKKGYGLRTNSALKANEFIFEYIGEVIGENVFRKRMQQYDEEGIKHFYFMSLTKGEFVDATKRGNLGRFCNHSCNPNCYVDKWVVGDKLRMGIFAERKIEPGEELVFNYNVDRYGADPQPCYCGEPNCTGYIGGKTQTERATKLSNTIIEALGIDDAEAWDTAVAKRPRKKKAGEDDEEYVDNVKPRDLDENDVKKVMPALMQCKEKWIAVKLLKRLQGADNDKAWNQIVKFHGYRIMKTVLTNFEEDVNVYLQVLSILARLPRLTRNKIQDSKIEETVEKLTTNEDERVASQSKSLLEIWSKLEVAYRIPRMKRDPNAAIPDRKLDRSDRRGDERRRSRSRSRSKSPPRTQAPTGPRISVAQRSSSFFSGPRHPPRPRPPPAVGALPAGWFEATAANGSKYYYNQAGNTTWQRPSAPAVVPPPPPPKAISDQQVLSDLIKNIVSSKKDASKQPSAVATPIDTPKKERKEDKWRSLPIEKQKRLYESALQPTIVHVMGKFKSKLAKDDLKRWAKEFAKLVVNADFKKDRVQDVNRISEKKAREVKKHAQAFFEKAVKKKEAAEKKKAEKTVKQEGDSHTPAGSPAVAVGSPTLDDVEDALSENEEDGDHADPDATPADSSGSPSALKRRREGGLLDTEEADQGLKRQRTHSVEAPPPPPPPPPADHDMTEDMSSTNNEHRSDSEMHQNGDRDELELSAARLSSAKGLALMQDSLDLEPSQVATPPTTGSPDQDEAEKLVRDANVSGMNPEEVRQIGLN